MVPVPHHQNHNNAVLILSDVIPPRAINSVFLLFLCFNSFQNQYLKRTLFRNTFENGPKMRNQKH
jgi:hypothetical protein